MTRLAAPTPAAPAELRRSRISLLDASVSVADRILDDRELFAGGLKYRPLPLPGSNYVGSFDPCTDPSATVAFPDTDFIDFPPFGIFATGGCPVIGSDVTDPLPTAAANAIANLITHRSHLIEEVLWTGLLQSGDNYVDIASDDTARALPTAGYTAITGAIDTAVDVVPAWSDILEWAADNAGGRTVQIHVPPALVPYLTFYGLVFRDGRRVLTDIMDYEVIVGTGYGGTTVPAGAAALAADEHIVYVTAPVAVAVSEPVTNGEGARSWVDRTNNRVEVMATSKAVFEWDTQIHGAIRVGSPNPGPGIS